MVVCGDDALARRLAAELRSVYGEQVTLVVPPAGQAPGPPVVGRARASALFGRVSAAVQRATGSTGVNGGNGNANGDGEPAAPAPQLEAAELTDEVLAEAGVERAAALALVHDDDETNIRAALAARRLNPRLRLVIRLYNRRLGQYLEDVLDQAAALASPGVDPHAFDASTTILSDADTAAPALTAAAVAGSSKVVQAHGVLLRAAERSAAAPGDSALCTLALLSDAATDTQGPGTALPQLLPDEASVTAADGRGRIVLETVSYSGPAQPVSRSRPLGSLLSPRLRWSFVGIVLGVVALAVTAVFTTGEHPLRAVYLTLLDLFSINEPAIGESTFRQVLQLLSGFVGLLLLPVLLAAVLEALGTFRSGVVTRRPPRGLSGHVVLLGLGKIGTRVLARLRELDIPVVCVESDPEARGMALARRLRVPVVLGDVTEEGVLEAAKIHRAHSLLALTSVDTTNLEAALYARSVDPELRVVMRLYDDDFATAVYRTLRAAHPRALTRSRSVSYLAAPAFAGAMMGRQILGAVPVERKVLLIAAVTVAGLAPLEGRTLTETFRPGSWRVLALDTSTGGPEQRPDGRERPEGVAPHRSGDPSPGLVWDLHPGYVLRPEDRVVLAATGRGLAELLGRRPRTAAPAPDGGG
ncbi:NAD-binding protein [Streptomyces sp. NPDC005955]|uniref:NAD-binding protein n=1 Tax=Streptomyces sp. NPDC005955 TaxID=3364738 RepID=UPI0036B72F4E